MKEDFLRKLRNSHAAIRGVIAQLQPFARNYEKAKPGLQHLYEQLLFHFMLFDDDLFDSLTVFHSGHRESLKMIEFLIHDLKDFKINMLTFFDHNSGEPGGGPHGMFPVQWTEFSKSILTRLDVEEKYLVSLIEQADR